MNKATVLSQMSISALVEKHMAELNELDRKYKDKLVSLNKRQAVAFREYVQKYDTIDHEAFAMEADAEEDQGEPKRHRRWFKLRDAERFDSLSEPSWF